MARSLGLLAVLAFLVLSAGMSSVLADYPRNGAILTNPDAYVYNTVMIASGSGGAIVAWCQGYSDAMDVYAQRVGARGELLWPPEGVAISAAADDQFSPVISSDGEGGAIVVWTDQRAGLTHLYAQRVDSTGTVLWDEDGAPVCTAASGDQFDPRILLCEGGDAIITWEDSRGGSYDIYAQRIDGDGNPVWTVDGVAICTAANDQNIPDLVSDDAGGAILAWNDRRSGNWDIYAQRIDADGNPLWAPNGVAACADDADQTNPRIASNMTGGAFIAWTDYRGYGPYGASDVYAQDIDSDGYGHWYMFPDGIWIAGESEYREARPQIVSDGAGGAIIAWFQDDPGAAGARAMRISEGGQFLWGYGGGVPLCNAEIDYEGLGIAPDGEGGIFAAWMDYRNGSTDVYIQRTDADGNILWSPNGTNICAGPGEIANIGLAPDESGGIVVAWADYRFVNYECACAQRVNADGWWGNPAPEILSCLDAPADQGGFVRVRLAASSHDVKLERDYPIEGYNVWRMIPASGGDRTAAASNGAAMDRARFLGLMTERGKTESVQLSKAEALALGFPAGEWESVGFYAATRDTIYNFLVPTKNDSTEDGTAMETYLVTAHAPAAGVFVVSNPDSGCSVDNLAPGVTGGFAGAEAASPHGLALSWNSSSAPDLWKYDVHRGDDASFVPDESNRIGTTDETTLFDGSWVYAYSYFYKLVAVDRHGNKGPAALLRPEDVKVGTLLANFTASLKQSAIEVSWTLSEAEADVRFGVMRAEADGAFMELESAAIVRDGLAFSLNDKSCEPGTSYKYRVDVVDERGRRALFTTEAISTPAMPLTLHQNHPNPFNPATTISYYLPDASPVTLEVYDSSGRLVSRLMDALKQEKGTHSIAWRGVDSNGRPVSSGVYFYRLTSGKETISKKMVLLR